MRQALAAQLSDQQREFVRNYISLGLPTELAAERAGYAKISGYRLLKMPAVALAISEAITFELQTVLAPLAVNAARTLLQCKDVSPRVRADLSMKILDRAGHSAPSKGDQEAKQHKPLAEMSQSELLAFIEKNQAEIDRMEGELAARATEVSAPCGVKQDDKPLDYLD